MSIKILIWIKNYILANKLSFPIWHMAYSCLSSFHVIFVNSAMEEEELQVALAISASMIDQEVCSHEVVESSRLV